VVGICVQDRHELADQLSVRGDDPDVSAGDDQGHRLVLVGAADSDVAEATEVAQGHRAVDVGLVLAQLKLPGLDGGRAPEGYCRKWL
jgi:hypothetical protein